MQFHLVHNLDAGGHHYRCYEVLDPDWLGQLAAEYVALRTECNFPVQPVQADGIDILDTAGVQARLQAATVPISTGGNFDVVRADLGEVLTYMIFQAEYGTSFGYKQVRDRELIQFPGRGIDAVGFDPHEQRVILCLGEAKVSNAASSPPGVVDAADDSMRNQHLGHLADLQATANKLWDLGRRARSPAQQNLFFYAALCFENASLDDIDVIAGCVLVRPAARYATSDFGTFRSTPADFSPANIRFLIIRIPDDVDVTVNAFVKAIAAVAA